MERERNPDVASSLASIKTVVAIVNGLTLTNTLLVLITDGHYSQVIPIAQLNLLDIAFAAVLIANIVRFYHGNIRHLDSAYGSEARAEVASGRHAEPRGGLGVDFFVIFAQSIMFSAASFYIGNHSAYLSIFMVLLTFDVLWTVYSQQDASSAAPQRRWLLNNLIALSGLVVLYLIHRSHPSADWLVELSLSVLAATTVVDFGLNWRFYFPSTPRRQQHEDGARAIFLSAPFTQLLHVDQRAEKDAFAATWNALADTLEAAGHRIFSAHRREAWGANLNGPELALGLDLHGLRESDLMVAYVGSPPSPGVQLEIGYALALRLQMLVFIDRDQTEPYLIRGLPSACAEVLEINDVAEINDVLASRGMLTATIGVPFEPVPR